MWHYQWVLLHDFLPSLVGEQMAMDLLAGGPGRYHRDSEQPFIPFEFADAAYRYGHLQIRAPIRWSTGPCCSTRRTDRRHSARSA